MASRQDMPSKKPTTKKAPAKPKPATQTTKPRAARRRAPTHEAISKRAYELSEAGAGGDDVSRWLQAERELTGS